MMDTNNAMDTQSSIFDKRAASFDNLIWVTDREFLGSIFSAVWELFQEYEHQRKRIERYVDVGTGTGEVLKFFSERFVREQDVLVGADAVGLDVSHEMLEIARKKIDYNRKVRWVQAPITNHGLDYRSFDFAITRNAFHHFDDLDTSLQEMRELVKPGGRIFIIEGVAPDNYTLARWRRVLLERDRGRNPEVLLSLENVEGFFVKRFGITPRIMQLPALPMQLSNWLDNALVDEEGKDKIMFWVRQLYRDKRFRGNFELVKTRKKPVDFTFKRRSVLIDLRVD